MAQLKVVEKSVNSKLLYNDIMGFLREGVSDYGIVWSSEPHRASFIHVINEFLYDIAESGKIDQFKVVGDKRNNRYTDMERGIYHIDVYYQQRNCLNTTHFALTIYDYDEDADEELLEFFGLKP